MSSLRLILQISLAIVAAIGAVIFSVAEEAPLAALTVPIALATLLTVDIWKWWSLPVWGANLLGLAGFIGAGYEFQSGGGEARLLAGGHLLAYLSWSMLPQLKTPRQVWWLLGLSVLQVAVSAVLTSQPWFGMAMVIYIFASLWTMAVISLYRAAIGATAVEQAPEANVAVPKSIPGLTVAAPASRGSRLKHGVKAEHVGRWLGWRFVWGGIVSTLLAIGVGLMFFVFTPRVWIQGIRLFDDSPLAGGTLTGFTDEVKLGDMGQILESSEIVMRIGLSNVDTGEAYSVADFASLLGDSDPAFRGAVMESYTNGTWARPQQLTTREIATRQSGANALRQTIELQPIGSPILFSIPEFTYVVSDSTEEPLFVRRNAQELSRGDDVDYHRLFNYSVVSPGNALSSMADTIRRKVSTDSRSDPEYIRSTLEFPKTLFRTKNLAHSLVADLTAKSTGILDRQAMADRLAGYLRDSGDFTYSLNLSVTDPTIDPVEDFLFNRKKGHCEYFASALALMLRSVAIPARLVSGFKGVQVNLTTNQLDVRQFHAHAWVEGYINGEWVTFDPTTGGREDSVDDNEQQSSGTLRSVLERTRNFWSAGMTLNKNQQDELVYAPLRDTLQNVLTFVRKLTSGESEIAKSLKALLSNPEEWFSWRGGVAVSALVSLLVGFVWVVRRIWLLVPRFRRRWQASRARSRRIAFYERLGKILTSAGCQRLPHETAQEFAQAASIKLKLQLGRAGLENVLSDLIARFYDVRFGEMELTPDQDAKVSRQLNDLESALRA